MDLWKDFRFAARLMIKARWFTLAAAIPLALGIGANTTVFTLVNAVLIRGLPFEDPDRIMRVWNENPDGGQTGVSYLDYRDWREEARSFASMAAVLNASVNVSDDEDAPERTQGGYVSWDFFRMLGVQPVLGRDFVEEDDRPGAAPTVLLGYSVWTNRFANDPEVLGATIRVNSLPATVIGVMPEGMRFPFNTDIYIARVNLPPESNLDDRGVRNFVVIGRLVDGTTIDVARDELRGIAERLLEVYPEQAADELRPNLMSFQDSLNEGEISALFTALMGAVAFVLLIACANVANLLLVRSADRTKEMAVRVSLGATRWRVVRQLLIESLLLALVAGVIGFGISIFGIRWFDTATLDVGKPYWMDFSLDGIVFAFIAAVCLSAAVMFGLAPAVQISKTNVNEVLKEGMRGGSGGLRARRWMGALIVGEVVLTLVLLSGAAFMMRSFLSLYTMETGIETENLVTMQLYLPLTQYPDPGPRAQLYEGFSDRLAAAPELETYAISTALPLGGGGSRQVEIDGKPLIEGDASSVTAVVMVSDAYFETFGIDLIQGRTFSRADGTPGSPVAIVNQRFVELHLDGGNALGRSVRAPSASMTIPSDSWLSVVGVVPNIRQTSLDERDQNPVLYLPLRADPLRTTVVTVRTPVGPASATPVVQNAMDGVNADIPFFNVRTMDDALAEVRWPFAIFGLMFSTFAGVALVLAAVGVYSVTAQTVVQRTREMGIRSALGAMPGQLVLLVLRRSLIQLAIAVPIGLLGALGVGQLLQSLLVQTSPTDPAALVTIVLILTSVAAAACVFPARRAGRVNPVEALRIE